MVHIESIGQDDNHKRYNKCAPDYQKDVNEPAEEGARVEVAIANSGHGDNGEPEGIFEFLNISWVRISVEMLGILDDQIPKVKSWVPFCYSDTDGKDKDAAREDNSYQGKRGILEQTFYCVQVVWFAPVHSAQSAGYVKLSVHLGLM